MKIKVFPVDEAGKKQFLYLEGGTPIKINELLDSDDEYVAVQEIWKAALGDKQEVSRCYVFPTWRHKGEIQPLLGLYFHVEDLDGGAMPISLADNSAFSVDATAEQIAEKLKEGGIEVEIA